MNMDLLGLLMMSILQSAQNYRSVQKLHCVEMASLLAENGSSLPYFSECRGLQKHKIVGAV
jgi:hypothetical protein